MRIAPDGLTVAALLDRVGEESRPAIVFPDARVGTAELVALTRAWARALVSLGVRPGDHVGAVLPPGLPVVGLILASARVGAVVVPLNNRLRPGEVCDLVDRSDMRVLLVGPDQVPGLDDALPGLADATGPLLRLERTPALRTVAVVGGDPGSLPRALLDWAGVVEAADRPDVDTEVDRFTAAVVPDDDLVVVYTSGTTAKPRGCVHSQASMIHQGASLATRIRLGSNDTFWTPLPFFHVGGFDVLFACLTSRATMVHMGQFDPAAALRQLQDERVTHAFPAFETIWMPVLNHPDFPGTDLSALRLVINVGSPERMRVMQERVPHAAQISCTGSTESAGFICVGEPSDPAEVRAVWAGSPVDGMEARIVDPETGVELPPNTPGEFVFRGISRFRRYYRDPVTTAERVDADGWYRSGDLLECDERGRFRFHSRLSDILKIGGENVAAAEIEDRIAVLPEVAVVQVVAAPDAHYGEVAAAFIQLAPGHDTIDADKVINHCLEHLASIKAPRYVRTVTEWPMSGTKIQKVKLRERIAAELSQAGVTTAPRLSRSARLS